MNAQLIIPAIVVALNLLSPPSGTAQNARDEAAFAWPAVTRTARPWTRWWWLGNAVDKENLTRELESYRKAGIGGVEVTCIYGVQGQDAREIPYLSPKWVEMLRHTCAEAKRLDMGVDLPPGSGWCIGGPQMPLELANANVAITAKAAEGGQPFHLSFGTSMPQALVAFIENSSPIHLTDKIDDKGELTWTPPAGKWTVYTVAQKFSGQKVKRPAPGGEGRVFNPFSAASMEAGLKPFDSLFDQLPKDAIRSQFHDSYEYQGDWTAELFSEFQKRCGYDLRDHLPAFTSRAPDEETLRVRADYRKVMSDLLYENISRWVDKAHAHGQLARNQAHGSPGNLLDLYAVADIPETEVFRDDQDPLVAKFASSAAHVAGHPLCSSETFTWMSEHFTETLGDMKSEADFLFACGINHIFYHGTAYSPADAAWPGWCFYASTEMNPRNSIWHDADALNTYFARVQSVLQEGAPNNDILLYWPASDVWQSPAGDAKHLLRHLAVHGKFWINDLPCGKLASKLWERGYGFDFISDRQIAAAKVDEHGRIETPGGRYGVLVLPACNCISPETMEQITRFIKGGAWVIVDSQFPRDVPGLGQLRERRARLRKAIDDAIPNQFCMVTRAVDATLSDCNFKRETMTDHPGLMFIRRATRPGWNYFICNHGQAPLDGWIALAAQENTAVIMDPMTGRVGRAATRERGDELDAYLQLQPGESILLRCVNARKGPAWQYVKNDGLPIALTGRWQLKFIEGGPELPPEVSTDSLASWTTFGESAQRFAGTARYTFTFDAPAKGEHFWLDLGNVGQSARVKLNGRDLGTVLMPPYRVRVDALQSKDNMLEVEVTNVSANRIRDLDRRGVKWRIFKDINLVNVNYKPFDASNWPLTDSGLIGPVTLQPVIIFDPAK